MYGIFMDFQLQGLINRRIPPIYDLGGLLGIHPLHCILVNSLWMLVLLRRVGVRTPRIAALWCVSVLSCWISEKIGTKGF